MARPLWNRQLRDSTGKVEQFQPKRSGPLSPLPRARRSAKEDWLSEFPQEPEMWVEVPHPRLEPPPHTAFTPFSPIIWIRTHPSTARTAALGLAVISSALLGVWAWMPREPNQPAEVITQSVTSDPLLARPVVTPPPAPPAVFTSQAATPRATASPERATTPPAPAPPPKRATDQASGRETASSPSSRGVARPLPAAKPPARPATVQTPPPATGASSSTITTNRPAVDRAPLILPAPAREPAALPTPTPTPAPAPPPPSAEARETAAVESVIERYRLAFSTLNSGVSDFWPGVNSRALDRAFDELDEQRFEFDQCRVQLNGAQAEATCTGKATFVPKVGNKTPRTQARQWSFRLVRAGNRWIIDSVQSR